MSNAARNPEIAKLTAEIDRHRQLNGMSRTAFGLWAVNDPNLLRDLENGRDLRWPTIEAIRGKMSENVASGGAV